MTTATTPTDDPLACIPDSQTLRQHLIDLGRRANALRRLLRISREREAAIIAAQATPPKKGGAK